MEKAPAAELNRYSRLLSVGAVLGSSALLLSGCANHKTDAAPPIYTNGETFMVTPGLSAQVVDGWKVRFKAKDIYDFIRLHQTTELDVVMHNQGGIEELRLTASSMNPEPAGIWDFGKTGDVVMRCNQPPGPLCYLSVKRDTTYYDGTQLKRKHSPPKPAILIRPEVPAI